MAFLSLRRPSCNHRSYTPCLLPSCKAQDGGTCGQVGSPGQDHPGKHQKVFWVQPCFRDCRGAGHRACPHLEYSLVVETENNARTRKGLEETGSQMCSQGPGGTDPEVGRACVRILALPLCDCGQVTYPLCTSIFFT